MAPKPELKHRSCLHRGQFRAAKVCSSDYLVSTYEVKENWSWRSESVERFFNRRNFIFFFTCNIKKPYLFVVSRNSVNPQT